MSGVGTIRERTAGSAGFTLLELLVSMTVLSLLATTILFGWRIAASAWQKASARLSDSRAVTETNRLIQEQMASMLPYQIRTEYGYSVFFQGEPKTARFISRYSLEGRAASGLYEVEYQLEDTPGKGCQLLMNESPVTDAEELGKLLQGIDSTPVASFRRFAPFGKTGSTLTLIQHIFGCRFEYYQPATPYSKGGWADRWPAVDTLPSAMALRFAEPERTNRLQQSPLVAAIRFNAVPKP